MGLIGLELSDAGIMAVRELPGALPVDGASTESPGYALLLKDRLLVGREAEGKARLYPLQCNNRFWDQLSTEPLNQPGMLAKSHAELAFSHLRRIWRRIQSQGDELILAVPGYLQREQLGLIVSMAEELSMPLKGIVGIGLASASSLWPESMLLCVDIHLHRAEVTFMEQGDRITQKESLTAEGKGLAFLHEAWVKVVADEFIHATRFDPLHRAESEQALYDRLPEILEAFSVHSSTTFEMTSGARSYRANLTRERFVHKSGEVFWEIRQLVAAMEQKHGKPGQGVTLLLSHRLSRLPGCREMLAAVPGVRIGELEPGSAARGALALAEEFGSKAAKGPVSYLTTRPLRSERVFTPVAPGIPRAAGKRPTHILYGDHAYPISERPLVIGTGGPEDGVSLRIEGQREGVSRKHCTVQRQGPRVVLTDHSADGTYVDGVRVSGQHVLQLGQVVRIGTLGQELQLIASVEADET